ncbi:hypothetical protein B7463_g1909, partial [Scytalidium lignicola]
MTETSPSPPPHRRFSPQPIETTVRRSRRFPIEPIETTTRSHKKEEQQQPQQQPKTTALPQSESMPISIQVESPPRRRFLPQPIETTFKSSRLQVPNALPTPDLTPIRVASPLAEEPKSELKPTRPRFTPQLIETSKRSKRAGDTQPATLPTDKTDITPGTNHIYVERHKNRPRAAGDTLALPDITPRDSLSSQIQPLPPRRQPSMRPHPNTRHSSRQNSFQPELEIIVSDENDTESTDDDDNNDAPESVPSLTGSFGSSDDSMMRQQLARTRESCDDRFSGYLLALAAKAAEKQLREQALAAFPNETFHEIVEHFYDREVESTTSDDSSIEAVGLLPHEANIKVQSLRRQSSADWATLEMQQHQENLNRLREDEMHKKLAAEARNPSFRDPFWSNGMTEKSPFARLDDQPILNKEKEEELQRMRSAASPPMLGGDIKFRMCPSPKATKFEADQPIDIHLNRVDDGGGLWGGYCVAEEVGEYILPPMLKGPDMLRTPDIERDDPFSTLDSMMEGSPSSSRPSSQRSNHMASGLDERLAAEMRRAKRKAALLEEFNDDFVTQVYNYLSLGYPALARQFDEELSKIAKVSIYELRMDDEKNIAHGHIGLKEADCRTAKQSARWKALKVYILEWGMQHPSMENETAAPSAWGVRARRGSWAI